MSGVKIMDADLRWAIGIGVTVAIAAWGYIRAILVRIKHDVDVVRSELDDDSRRINNRIDRVLNETVRKADLDRHIDRITSDMREMRAEQRTQCAATNKRLDELLAAIMRD